MADTNLLQQSPFIDPENQALYTDLQRKQMLANLLTQKGMEAPQGQMVGNRYVAPSWSQNLATLFNAYSGKNLSEQVGQEQAKLAEALRAQKQKGIEEFVKSGEIPAGQTVYGAGEEGPTKQTGLTYGQRVANLQKYNPQLAETLMADMLKTHNVAEGATLQRGNLGTGAFDIIGQGGEKKPTEYKEYEKAVEGGFKGSFFDYQTALKRAGAQPINVSVGKDLAGQVGDIMKTSATAAQGAVQTIQSADKILSAIPNAITGKGAETRLTANQWADTLGVGGKDTQSKLDNTRQIMQETAKLALAAPPRGQGAVSDYERALFAKAAGGDVNLTPTELRLIANRAKEGSQYIVQAHQQKLNAMKANPETASLVPYYEVNAPQPQTVQPSAALAKATPSFRWNPQTGQLESIK